MIRDMKNDKLLGRAIELATFAHSGQFDRQGKPYILHPLHLMNQLMFDVELAIIAVLHDVPEDTIAAARPIGISSLRMDGFSDRVLDAVELLTHDPVDSYEFYIEKITKNYDAIRVKRKDLEHNSDITRLKGITPKDIERIEKYHKAFLVLGKAKDDWAQLPKRENS